MIRKECPGTRVAPYEPLKGVGGLARAGYADDDEDEDGDFDQAGQAYRSPNARAFEIFDFSTFYTRACRVPHIHQ